MIRNKRGCRVLVYLLARMAATYSPRKTFADFDEMLSGEDQA